MQVRLNILLFLVAQVERVRLWGRSCQTGTWELREHREAQKHRFISVDWSAKFLQVIQSLHNSQCRETCLVDDKLMTVLLLPIRTMFM